MKPTDDDAPPWPDDSFARFLHDAARNEPITAFKYQPVYALLRDIHIAYEEVNDSFPVHPFSGSATPGYLVTRFMLVRTHGAFLAASRLGLSTQALDVAAVIRVGVELAWYALHVAQDPAPPQRLEIWLRRRDGKAALHRCKTEFAVGNVRKTHERSDPAVAAFLSGLYENLIDNGAHPNQGGVLGGIKHQDHDDRDEFIISILDSNPLTVMYSLRRAAILGAGALMVFSHVFPAEFARLGMRSTLAGIIRRINTVFVEFPA